MVVGVHKRPYHQNPEDVACAVSRTHTSLKWYLSDVLYSHNTCRSSSWKVSPHSVRADLRILRCPFDSWPMSGGGENATTGPWIHFHRRAASLRGTVMRGFHNQASHFAAHPRPHAKRKCVGVSCGPRVMSTSAREQDSRDAQFFFFKKKQVKTTGRSGALVVRRQ